MTILPTTTLERWQSVGQPTTLPTSLSNEHVTLTFVADATHGVRLATIADLAIDQTSDTGYTWTMAEGLSLWRIGVRRVSDWGNDFGSDFGGGSATIDAPPRSMGSWGDDWGNDFEQGLHLPTPDVVASRTTVDGDPALCFRWLSVPRPDGGNFEVTVLVALGANDLEARWSIHVQRDTPGDGLDVVEFPRFLVMRPAGPARARVLLPTVSPHPIRPGLILPSLGSDGGTTAFSFVPSGGDGSVLPMLGDGGGFTFETIPGSTGGANSNFDQWQIGDVATHHPTGQPDVLAQQLQVEALAAVFPGRITTERPRCLTFMTDDRRGNLKRWARGSTTAGTTTLFLWTHSFVPPWATRPILGPESTSRDGAVFYAPYRVLVGVLPAKSGSWAEEVTAHYRDVITAAGPDAIPKSADTGRTDLARGMPLVVARGVLPYDGTVAGTVLASDAEKLRILTRRPRVALMPSDLRPVSSVQPSAIPGGFTKLRGTNWIPGHATWGHCLPLAYQPMVDPNAARPVDPTDGFFHPLIIAAELDELQAVGFKHIRTRGSMLGWAVDRIKYFQCLKGICAAMVARGMGITYELWTSTPAGYAAFALGTDTQLLLNFSGYDGATLRANLWDFCEQWQIINAANIPARELDLSHWPEPLSGQGWINQGRFGDWTDTTFQRLVGEYVREVAYFFANDPDARAAFVSMDIYNEAGVPAQATNDPALKTVILSHVNEFMLQCATVIRSIFPAVQFTGGSSDDQALQLRGARLSYLGRHIYNFFDPARGPSFAALNEAFFQAYAADIASVGPADALGMANAVTEFFVTPENDGQMHRYLNPILAAGMGFQTWAHLEHNAWRSLPGRFGPQHFDGIRRCTTAALDVTTSMLVSDWGDDFGDDFGPGLHWEIVNAADDAAVMAALAT